MLRFFLFLIRVQWIDRLATSSFLIGITVQTALLTLALYRVADDAEHALVLATRASMLTCTAIVLLSAMSNIQNEFRYGTIERVLLGKVPFEGLLGVRSAASAIVASPAIIVPFIGAAVRYPGLVAGHTMVLVIMVYIFLGTLCFQSTLLLCQFRNPSAMVPWVRMALLFLGLSVIPFEGSRFVSYFFPTGWILSFAHDTDAGSLVTNFVVFIGVVTVWTGGAWLGLRRRSHRLIEINLTDGVEAS
ncbi:hypothetical protein [Streptomyces muensis]|uniref:Uncharacterized protein n=1 Tax=Streptomyces muensis TaxID=1077944 RepID=A0A9X1TQ50_STRM4|nr:hypothetical protein [Streptomyces muensis]MCF1598464.1 hypothetical protein [Streptomyces muensis]